MNWTKNLGRILLPRYEQRSQTRYWTELAGPCQSRR